MPYLTAPSNGQWKHLRKTSKCKFLSDRNDDARSQDRPVFHLWKWHKFDLHKQRGCGDTRQLPHYNDVIMSVSNHQRLDGFPNFLFRCRSKKTSNLRVTCVCEGNSLVSGEFPHNGPVKRKMLPFDDVIMTYDRDPLTEHLGCIKSWIWAYMSINPHLSRDRMIFCRALDYRWYPLVIRIAYRCYIRLFLITAWTNVDIKKCRMTFGTAR